MSRIIHMPLSWGAPGIHGLTRLCKRSRFKLVYRSKGKGRKRQLKMVRV